MKTFVVVLVLLSVFIFFFVPRKNKLSRYSEFKNKKNTAAEVDDKTNQIIGIKQTN